MSHAVVEPTPAAATPRPAVLAIILVSYLMIVLDISIVITGLPRVREDLGFSAAGLSWVQNAYTLSFGGLLLLGARAGDILGRRRMLVVGLGVFTAASMLIGLAQSPTWLLTARAVQGFGAAILAPSTLALLSTSFPEGPARTRAVAWYGAVAGIGASLGMVLGGLLADWVSWRAGFFINLPIGVILIVAASRHLAETERHPGRFDIAGAVSSTAGMTALVYGVVRSAEAGWADPFTRASMIAGLALLGFLIVNEGRAAQPIMPLRLFASRQRAGAYAGRILFLGAMMGFWFFTTQYLQGVLGFTPFQAGLAFLPMTLANFVVAMSVPRLSARLGNGGLLVLGLAATLIGMLWLSRLSGHGAYLASVALPMILIGAGQGGTLSPLTVAGVSGVEARDAGAASGLVNVAHQLGGSLGLAVLVVVFATAKAALPAQDLLAHRISTALTGSCLMLLAALIVVAALILAPTLRRSIHE
jgi:EmrB/QacA subfamily drug resistance transporter